MKFIVSPDTIDSSLDDSLYQIVKTKYDPIACSPTTVWQIQFANGPRETRSVTMRIYLSISAGLLVLGLSLPLSAQDDATGSQSGVGDSAGIGDLDTGSALEQNENFQADNRGLGIVGGAAPEGGFTGQAGTENGGNNFGGGAGGAGGFGSFFNSFNQQLNQQGQNTDRSIRVPMRLGFVQVRPAPRILSGRVARQLTKLPKSMGSHSVSVVMEGKTAVLQGVVKTDHSRVIAERLALLEPGISRVRNELVVQATAAEELKPPQPLPLPIPGN
jgi:hypothetical protein